MVDNDNETQAVPMVPTFVVPDVTKPPSDHIKMIREKMLHILKYFPVISPSMMGISVQLPATMWRPILQSLIHEGLVKEELVLTETPQGRHQAFTRLSLMDTPTSLPE